jgi:AcrR family transcriptional regulator
MTDLRPSPQRLRRVPQQERSREKLRRLLDAADEVLAREGAGAMNTVRIADVAGVSVASLYRYLPDKQAIAEALAGRYWRELQDLVAGVAQADERELPADPFAAVLDALAGGFRARPGFLALWYGGLRTERVRDVTRSTRDAVADSLQRIIAVHWPQATPELRFTAARMCVLIGDGLLREAFRIDRDGDPLVLAEARHALHGYVTTRLGEPRAQQAKGSA